MDLGLSGKRALVLGASTGLGKAIAAELAREGATVAICARSEARVQQAAVEIGADAALTGDLSAPGVAAAVVAQAAEALGGLDILVTNTGGPPAGPFMDLADADWQRGFDGLWQSAAGAIRAAVPGMREQHWGRILLLTSVAAREPIAGLTVSNALRAGLLGLTNTLAREIAGHGITVNALLPGYTRTERLAELGVAEERLAAEIPAGRLGRPEELASLAAFLASDRAAYITGQAIACDGGWLRAI